MKMRSLPLLGLALIITGLLTASAATYSCPMRDELGARWTLAIGELFLIVGGWIQGFHLRWAFKEIGAAKLGEGGRE